MLGWAMLKNATKVAHCPKERFFVLGGMLVLGMCHFIRFHVWCCDSKLQDLRRGGGAKTAYGLFQHATTRECPSHYKSIMSMTASNYHAAADREATEP